MKNISWNQLTTALANNQRANFADAAKAAAAKAATIKDRAVEVVKDAASNATNYLPVLGKQLEKANDFTDSTFGEIGARLNIVEDVLLRNNLTTEEELDNFAEAAQTITSALKAARKGHKVTPVQEAVVAPAVIEEQPQVQAAPAPSAPVAPESGTGTRRRLNFDRALES